MKVIKQQFLILYERNSSDLLFLIPFPFFLQSPYFNLLQLDRLINLQADKQYLLLYLAPGTIQVVASTWVVSTLVVSLNTSVISITVVVSHT